MTQLPSTYVNTAGHKCRLIWFRVAWNLSSVVTRSLNWITGEWTAELAVPLLPEANVRQPTILWGLDFGSERRKSVKYSQGRHPKSSHHQIASSKPRKDFNPFFSCMAVTITAVVALLRSEFWATFILSPRTHNLKNFTSPNLCKILFRHDL